MAFLNSQLNNLYPPQPDPNIIQIHNTPIFLTSDADADRGPVTGHPATRPAPRNLFFVRIYWNADLMPYDFNENTLKLHMYNATTEVFLAPSPPPTMIFDTSGRNRQEIQGGRHLRLDVATYALSKTHKYILMCVHPDPPMLGIDILKDNDATRHFPDATTIWSWSECWIPPTERAEDLIESSKRLKNLKTRLKDDPKKPSVYHEALAKRWVNKSVLFTWDKF